MNLKTMRTQNPFTSFYLKLCLIISLVIIAMYVGIYLRDTSLIMDAVTQQARSYYDLLIKVRRWNATYGGVYVEKKEGTAPNKYLIEMGINPDITVADGRTFTLKNPFLMTYEVSNIVDKEGGIRFHITSLRLVNPSNAPDTFERDSLTQFERGAKECWTIEKVSGGPVLRYMAPLVVEQPCQKCHFRFKYRLGDIRGGICINIPVKKLVRDLAINRLVIICLSVFTLVILLGSAYYILTQMVTKLDAAHQALREASITDDLTGLRNRRYFMTRFDEEIVRSRRDGFLLGLLMIDLDDFKRINDSYGHQFGDVVLVETAKIFSDIVREYDIAARYGGEEFALIVTVKSTEDLHALAERVRERIKQVHIHQDDITVRVTASIGAAALEARDSAESLLKRADNALYQAKKEGRDRVVVA